jgi:hypothetical protein
MTGTQPDRRARAQHQLHLLQQAEFDHPGVGDAVSSPTNELVAEVRYHASPTIADAVFCYWRQAA